MEYWRNFIKFSGENYGYMTNSQIFSRQRSCAFRRPGCNSKRSGRQNRDFMRQSCRRKSDSPQRQMSGGRHLDEYRKGSDPLQQADVRPPTTSTNTERDPLPRSGWQRNRPMRTRSASESYTEWSPRPWRSAYFSSRGMSRLRPQSQSFPECHRFRPRKMKCPGGSTPPRGQIPRVRDICPDTQQTVESFFRPEI